MNCVNWNELEWDDVMPGIKRKVIHAESFTMVRVDLEQNLDLSFHNHIHEQAILVLEGGVELMLEDEARSIDPGDVVRIPPGAKHGGKVCDKHIQLIDLFTPQRDEFSASAKRNA